jgi:kynurenine formamidase
MYPTFDQLIGAAKSSPHIQNLTLIDRKRIAVALERARIARDREMADKKSKAAREDAAEEMALRSGEEKPLVRRVAVTLASKPRTFRRRTIDKGAVMTGADCWATEVVPNPDKNLAFPVHGELITKNGIYNHENLDFTALIADGKYQFVYIFAPAPIKGATGSNSSPIAIT